MNTHEGSFKVVRDGQGRQFTVMGAKVCTRRPQKIPAVHTRSQLKPRRPTVGCRFMYIIAKTRPCTFSRASTRSSAETERFAQLRVPSSSYRGESPTVSRM
jgi:hypothetical protein